MLTLMRKTAETIVLYTASGQILLHVDQARRGRVKLSIEAPSQVKIVRGEFLSRSPPAGDSFTRHDAPPSSQEH